MPKEAHEYQADGKRDFTAGRYAEAAEAFRQASRLFTLGRSGLLAAEMDNNLSVALLKNKQPREALEAARGTELVFAGDKARQAMALGNQGAALEDLKKYAEAIALYEQAGKLFSEAGQSDMQSLVYKSIATIRLKQGDFSSAGIEMLSSASVSKKPTLLQRITRFIMRLLS